MRELLQQALDALKELKLTQSMKIPMAIAAIEKELAKPEQDHGFDRTASHMAGEYVDTAEQEPETPKIIYLQTGCDCSDDCECRFNEIEGMTWCQDKIHDTDIQYIRSDYTSPPRKEAEKSELEKDAINLLLALRDAWPYVHERCTIESIKKSIIELIRKHGDFADLQPPRKEWVGLTDEEIGRTLYNSGEHDGLASFARAIEAELRSKNER